MFNDWWKGVSEQLPQLREQLTEQINQTLAPWLPSLVEEVKVGKHHLRILRKLGEGGYSFVYLAEETLPETSLASTPPTSGIHISPQPRKYALKKVLAGEKEQLSLAEREILVMKRELPKHPNLLPLIESQVVKAETYVVYMLFPLMETNVWDYVQDRLKSNLPLSTLEATHIFSKLCHALHAMHSTGPGQTVALSHRDVKPHNILLSTQKPLPPELLVETFKSSSSVKMDRTGADADDAAHLIVTASASSSSQQKQPRLPHAVLMDFGSVAPAEVQITSRTDALVAQEDAERRTTAPYRAPELWDVPSSCTIDTKVDIWAAGCVLYYLLVGESPFERTAEAGGSLMLAIVNGQWSWPAGIEQKYPKELRDLVDICLKSDPAERPSAAELLEMIQNMNSLTI